MEQIQLKHTYQKIEIDNTVYLIDIYKEESKIYSIRSLSYRPDYLPVTVQLGHIYKYISILISGSDGPHYTRRT